MSTVSSVAAGCCAPCLLGGDYVVVTPPFELGTEAVTHPRTLIPLVTIDSAGSSHTTGTKTITPETLEGIEPTYVVNGAVLTAPTQYAYYTHFAGALPPTATVPTATLTGWNNSACAKRDGLFDLDIPALTDTALAFMLPLASTSAVPSSLPSEVVQYLDQVDTVQIQMGGNDLGSCSPTYYQASCPTSRPPYCPTYTSTATVVLTSVTTVTFVTTVTNIGSSSTDTSYSITIETPSSTSASSTSGNPCVSTIIIATIETYFATEAVTALEKPTRSVVSYSDQFGSPEVASYTPAAISANAPQPDVASDDNEDEPTSDDTPDPDRPQAEDTPTPDSPTNQPDSGHGGSALATSPITYTLHDNTQVTYTPKPITVTNAGSVATYIPAPSISTTSGQAVAVVPTPQVSTVDGQPVTYYPPALSSSARIGDYIISGVNSKGGNAVSETHGTGVSSMPPQYTGAARKPGRSLLGSLLGAAFSLMVAL